MIPLLAEDGSISNDLFKWLCGGEALAIIAMAGYIVKLQATARSDMLANLPVLTLAREMLESVKTTMDTMKTTMNTMTTAMSTMTAELREMREAVQRCGIK